MCGVFGVRSVERDVARLTYFGLFALQHRGQESAGIAVSDTGSRDGAAGDGPRAAGVRQEKLSALPGEVAIGHTQVLDHRGRPAGRTPSRWSTTADERIVALGHNGNLVEPEPLREELVAAGAQLASTSDTELIAAFLARAPGTVRIRRRHDGAGSRAPTPSSRSSTTCWLPSATRWGIRPLTLGRIGDDWVVASETCALDLLGADVVRDVFLARSSRSTRSGCHSAQGPACRASRRAS